MQRSGSDYYIYQTLDPKRARTFGRVSVVFCASVDSTPDSLFARLRDHMEAVPPPDRILLIGAEHEQNAVVTLAENDLVRNGLPSITRYLGTPPIVPLVFDR